jgi:hypothetical protein
LSSRLEIKHWSKVISANQHFAGSLGIKSLIGIPDGGSAEIDAIGQADRKQDKGMYREGMKLQSVGQHFVCNLLYWRRKN